MIKGDKRTVPVKTVQRRKHMHSGKTGREA